MALYRQGVGSAPPPPPPINGNHKMGAAHRLHDHLSVDHEEGAFRLNGFTQGECSSAAGRSMAKGFRGKRLVRAVKNRECTVGLWVALLISGLSFSVLLSYYLFAVGRSFTGDQDSWGSDSFFGYQVSSHDIVHHRHEGFHQDIEKDPRTSGFQKEDSASGIDSANSKSTFNRDRIFKNLKQENKEGTRNEVQFGLDVNARIGHRDSRDWDSDDRKREPVGGRSRQRTSHFEKGKSSSVHVRWMNQQLLGNEDLSNSKDSNESYEVEKLVQSHDANSKFYHTNGNREGKRTGARIEDLTNESLGLYNEKGRQELRKYEEQFEASLQLDLGYDSKKEQTYMKISAEALQGEDTHDEASDYDPNPAEGKNGESKVPPYFHSRKQFI